MGSTAIQIEGLGKKYRIGAKAEPYYSLRESLMKMVKAPLRRFERLSGKSGPEEEMFWALKDVSLEVRKGEVLGVIGPNGAGKTTLLKILSRVTRPTEGIAKVYGRVGSLLEVGTGFHPELTGRENIQLSGAVLGMTKDEIRRKFDEIVDFSGVEKFLDTPVKRYSAGMQIRLGFSVAAHLDPEILLVDEILAVGDAEFQKKCLTRMHGLVTTDRTILFVSHNMSAIEKLCARCVLFNHGRVVFIGDTQVAVARHLESIAPKSTSDLSQSTQRQGNGEVRITGISFYDLDHNPVPAVGIGHGCKICLDYETAEGFVPKNVEVGIVFQSAIGANVLTVCNLMSGHNVEVRQGSGRLCCVIPSLPLSEGTYRMAAFIVYKGQLYDRVDGAASFTIYASDFYGSGRMYVPGATHFYLEHEWETK